MRCFIRTPAGQYQNSLSRNALKRMSKTHSCESCSQIDVWLFPESAATTMRGHKLASWFKHTFKKKQQTATPDHGFINERKKSKLSNKLWKITNEKLTLGWSNNALVIITYQWNNQPVKAKLATFLDCCLFPVAPANERTAFNFTPVSMTGGCMFPFLWLVHQQQQHTTKQHIKQAC